MPAPAITVTRGNVPYTVQPAQDPARPGWELRGSMNQASVGAPFSLTASLVRVDPSQIDAEDLPATYSVTKTKPVNELMALHASASSPEEAAIAEMQRMFDDVWDNEVPSPASPPTP